MLLSQAMAEGLFHPRCRHGLGTYYPEIEDIVHYETEDNKLNEYGTEELNRAHVENMIQKYKRLTVGSIDPANIAKYQARLNEWERRKAQLGIANSENSDTLFERNSGLDFDKGTKIEDNNTSFMHTEEIEKPTGSDLFTEQEQKKLYQTERIISGNRYETAVVYDDTGKIIFKKKGSFDNVSFTKAQLSKLKGKIITHNHPSCSGLSADDIMFMQNHNLAEMRSCNMFGTHIMRPTKKSLPVSYDVLDKRLDEIYNELANKYRDIAAQNGKSIVYYLQDIEVETMKTISKEHNFYYEWKPIK